MANALTKPKFRHPLAELGPISPDFVSVSVESKTAGTATSDDTSLDLYEIDDSVPWGFAIESYYSSDIKSAMAGQLALREGLAADAADELATALGEMSDAQDELDAATSALEAASSDYTTADNAFDDSRMERWKALINLETATATGIHARIIAAQSRLDAANAAKAAASATLATATTALSDAVSLVEGKRGARKDKGEAAAAARIVVINANFQVVLAQLNYDNAPEIGGDSWGAFRNAPGSGGLGRFDWQFNAFGDDSFGCHVSNQTLRSWSSGKYQIRVELSDEFYQGAKGQSLVINLEVNEVRVSFAKATDVYTYPTAGEGEHQCEDFTYYSIYGAKAFTITPANISLAVDDAEQDPDTLKWILISPIVTVPLPDLGSADEPADATSLSIAGAPLFPTSEIDQIQRCGAQRNRQGWAEFTTQDGDPTRRYLTMTSSKTPTGPRDKTYSGSLALVPKDVPIVGDPSPLVIHDTLSDDAKAIEPPAPTNSYTVTDEAKIISPLIREVDNPKGLIWTLSNELTSEEILSSVNAIASQAWVGDLPFLLNFDALSLAYPDYAAQQKARFKLKHRANDTREIGDTFTTTHKWRLVTRNADTGVVTFDEQEMEIEWSVVDGSELEQTDDDWTEIPIPAANEEIRLEVLPGENEDPHTFGAFVPVLALP